MDHRRELGNKGESLAGEFLRAKGLEILETQYKLPFGEIDLVCRDGDEVVFVEVKTRTTPTYGYPEDSVTPQKIKHLLRVAQAYLEAHAQEDVSWRIDVVAIEQHLTPSRITHIEHIDIPEAFW